MCFDPSIVTVKQSSIVSQVRKVIYWLQLRNRLRSRNQKFDAQKNLLSLTFQSINIVLTVHVICHMTIFLKILKLTKLVVDLRKEQKNGIIAHF